MRLTTAQINHIEEEASVTLREAFGNISSIKLPVDVDTILEQNGLRVLKAHFTDRGVSGSFDRRNMRIIISPDESKKRQAFTAAHELGHYKLHRDALAEILYRQDLYRLDNSEPLAESEREANWFASSLLMPKELVERLWNTYGDADALASIFGVSKSAMYFRLKNLNLI